MPFNAGAIEASLTLNRDPFNAGLDQARADGEEFESQPITATLDLDSGEAESDLAEFQSQADELEADPIVIAVDADSADAEAALAALQAQGDDLEATPIVLDVAADAAEAEATLVGIEAQGEELDGNPIVIDVAVNPGEAEATLAAFSAQLVGIETEAGAIDLSGAVTGVDELTASLEQLDAPAVGAFSGLAQGVEAAELDLDRLNEQLTNMGATMHSMNMMATAGPAALANLVELQSVLDEIGPKEVTVADGFAEIDDAAATADLSLAGLLSSASAAALGMDDLTNADREIAEGLDALGFGLEGTTGLANGLVDSFDAATLSLFAFADEGASMTEDMDNLALISQDLSEGILDLGTAIAEAGEAGLTAEEGFQLFEGGAVDVEDAMADAEDAVASTEVAIQSLVLLLAGGEAGLIDMGDATNLLSLAFKQAGGAGGGFIDDISGLGEAMSNDGNGISFMQVAIVALVGALISAIPVVGAFIGEIGAFAAIGFTAFAGLGAFILGSIGDFSKLEAAAKSALTAYEAVLKPVVTPVINSAIPLIQGALTDLLPIAVSASAAIGAIIKEFSTDLRSSGFATSIAWVAANTGPALETIFHFVNNIAQALEGMGSAGQPFIDMIERGLVQFSADLNNFSTSNTFTDFVHWLVTEGPIIGEDLEQIGKSFGKMFVEMSPAGMALLTVFKDTMAGLVPIVGLLGQALSNPAIDGLALAVGGALVVIPLLGTALTGLAAAATTAGTAMFTTLLPALGVLALPAAVVGIAALATALGAWIGSALIAKENTDALNDSVNKLTNGVLELPTRSLPQATTALRAMEVQLASLKAQTDSTRDSITNLGTAGPNGVQSGLSAPSAAVAALTLDIQHLQEQIKIGNDDLGYLQQQFGVSREAALALADSIGLNLDKSLSPQQIAQFSSALQDQAKQAGLSAEAFAAMSQADGAAFQKMISAGNSAASAMQTTWSSFGSAVTAFSSGTLPATEKNITAFYALSELQGAQFASNVQTALQQGYNPTLIAQVLQAGPAQAGALLQGLVSNAGAGMVSLVNSAASAIASEGTLAIEEARLTAEAMKAPTSQIADALPTALQLYTASTATNAAAQIATLAGTYTGGLIGLAVLAHDYGISIPNAIWASAGAAQNAGAAQGNAALSGLTSVQKDIDTAALHAGAAVPTAFSGQTGAASTAGAALGSAAAAGIAGRQQEIESAAAQAGAAAGPAFSNAANWSAIGESIDSGIAGGIGGGTGLLQAAMASLAGQTLLAGEAAIQKGSPARLFIPLGLSIPEGIAAGITGGAGLVSGALGAVLKQSMPSASLTTPNYNFGEALGPALESAASRGATLNSNRVVNISVAGNADKGTIDQIRQVVEQALDEHDNDMINELEAI